MMRWRLWCRSKSFQPSLPQLWFAMDLELIALLETTQEAAPSQNQEGQVVQAAASSSRCWWWARWGSPPATSASPTRSAATVRGPTPTSPPPDLAYCLSPRRTGTVPLHPPPLKKASSKNPTSCISPIQSLPALHWCPDTLYKDNQSDIIVKQFFTSERRKTTANQKLYSVCVMCVQQYVRP